MEILKAGNIDFEQFKLLAKEKMNKGEYADFLKSISEESYDCIYLELPVLSGCVGATVYRYFSKKQNKPLFFTEVGFTNYVDDYEIFNFLTDKKPAKQNVKNMILQFPETGDEV